MILHSHGWGGSRTTDPAAFQQWLDARYAVLSFDQRGFGESGGTAQVENPDVEGHDVRALVDLVASKRWVKKDGTGRPAAGRDRRQLRRRLPVPRCLRGAPAPRQAGLRRARARDHLERPQPQPRAGGRGAHRVGARPRAAGLPTQALSPAVYQALVQGAATGFWPDGSLPVPGTRTCSSSSRRTVRSTTCRKVGASTSPCSWARAPPTRCSTSSRAWTTGARAITRKARRHSIFVGYNGGHVLPAVYPPGVDVTSDPCSQKLAGGDFATLALRFMNENLKRRDTGLKGYGKLHLATPASTCTTVERVTADTEVRVGTVATTETGGAALAFPVATGPIRIAGSAYLTGTLTALGLNNRAFYGLGVGSTPLDAALVQNNVMPLNEPRARRWRAAPHRAPGGRRRRTRRQDALRDRLTDQRDVRRHGQPYAGCGHPPGHRRPPPRRRLSWFRGSSLALLAPQPTIFGG